MKTAYERLLVKVQPSYSRRSRVLAILVPCNDHQEQQQLWSGDSWSLEDSCVCCRKQLGKRSKPCVGVQKMVSESQIFTLFMVAELSMWLEFIYIELFTCWDLIGMIYIEKLTCLHIGI